MRAQLYTCALVDRSGSVLHITSITAVDPIDAGRHAEMLASSWGGDIAVEMRRADDPDDSGLEA